MKVLSPTYEVVQLVADYKPAQGAVVGRVTATGEYGAYHATAGDGLQAAVAVVERTNGWPTSREATLLTHNAIVPKTSLNFGNNDADQIATAVSQLLTQLIVVADQ